MTMSPEQRKASSDRMKKRWADRKSGDVPTKPEPVQAKVNEIKGAPPNLFSGFVKKFDFIGVNGYTDEKHVYHPIPGYRLYGFLDRENGMRIAQAIASGWEFVTRDELVLNDAWNTDLNTDLGEKVRIYGGTSEEGKPAYHYIMKKTLELCAKHDEEREKYHLMIEASLRAGTFNMTPGEKRYTSANPPQGSPSGLPPITISHKMTR